MRIRELILSVIFCLCFILPGYAQAKDGPEVELLNIKITPSAVSAGDDFCVSITIRVTRSLAHDCFLFLHLEGPGFFGFENADVALAEKTSEWKAGERITLGPFHVHVPDTIREGEYYVALGLAYKSGTALQPKYKKIPYSGSGIKDWRVGKIIVKKCSMLAGLCVTKEYMVSAASSLEKVFLERQLLKKIEKEAVISGARNEYESFQVIVIPGNSDLQGVTVEASDFVNKETGSLISKDNFRFYKVSYVKTKKPYYNTPHVGFWPDPLPALSGAFFVAKETLQPVWVTLHLPKDALAGVYTGHIIVQAKNQKTKVVPVKVRVWGFNLPDTPSLKTAFDFYEYLVDLRHPKKEGEEDAAYKERMVELKNKYYLNMLAHRLSPVHNAGNPVFQGENEKGYLFDFSDFDAKVSYYLKAGQRCFGIGQEWPWGYEGLWSDKWYGFKSQEVLLAVFTQYGRHLEERGWLDKAYAYIFDETFNRVKEITALIHKAHPKIKNLLTMFPQEGYPDVDIWCVRTNDLGRKSLPSFRKSDKEFWTYVSSPVNSYPSLNLDSPSLDYRAIPWICWRYHLQGLLYWCVNWWQKTNPWDDPMTYPEQNGNGSLYYPDPEGINPVGSIRLEVLRDGLEDYEYLLIAERRLEALKASEDADEELIDALEEVLGSARDAVRSALDYSRLRQTLGGLREKIGSLIELAQPRQGER